MNRRTAAAAAFLVAACGTFHPSNVPVAFAAADPGVDPATGWVIHQSPATKPSKAYVWMHIMQEASGRSVDRVGARPTIISREMHVVVTSMYDAWAAYDAKAVGTRLGGSLRRPPAERTLANKEKAVAYAAYVMAVYSHYRYRSYIRETLAQGKMPWSYLDDDEV